MTLLSSIVVVVFGLFLIGLTCVVFAAPTLAERFLVSFASSARAHYVEMACRLLIGSSLAILSPVMWQPQVFRVIGWVIVITSIALILIPWRWHHRFATLVLPTLVRRKRFYAVALFASGCLLLYGVLVHGAA